MQTVDRIGPPPRGAGSGGGAHPAAAPAVLAVCGALALFALGCWAVARPPWTFEQWFFVVDLSDAVVYGLVASVLLTRSRHPVAWLLALTAVGGGLAAAGAGWTHVLAEHPDLPRLGLLQMMQNTGWVPGTLSLIVVVPWLVRERPLGPGPRFAVGVGVATIGWFLVSRLTDPWPWPEGTPFSPFGIRSSWWTGVLFDWDRPQVILLCVLGAVATAAVAVRWARSGADDRRGLGWLAIATGLMTASFVPLALTSDLSSHLPLELTPVVHLLSQAFLPAALLVAVLRQRLWGLDLAVSRGVLWSGLTAAVLSASAAAAGLTGALLPSRPGMQQAATTALVVLAFVPFRTWLQRRVDHLVRGEVGEPMRVVRRVGRQFGVASDAAELVDGLAAGLVQALRLGQATIEDPDGVVVARAGDAEAAGEPEIRELVHQQARAGRLAVTPRPGERLDHRTVEALDELVPVLAAAVHLSTTTRELVASRARIAAARDDERRALRRELHDGLGPAIAGVGLGLRAARNVLDRDPQAAAALLDQLAAELDASVEEVRGLARGLLPPVLDDLGLVPALLELAERYRVGGLEVVVEPADDLDDVDPQLATTVFGIVSEAVRNVHRHAAAGRCVVSVHRDVDLVVVVEDDGIGIAADARRGVGLTSMRERAEGAGGVLALSPRPPHGTRVEARIPVAAEVAPEGKAS